MSLGFQGFRQGFRVLGFRADGLWACDLWIYARRVGGF